MVAHMIIWGLFTMLAIGIGSKRNFDTFLLFLKGVIIGLLFDSNDDLSRIVFPILMISITLVAFYRYNFIGKKSSKEE